MVCFHVGTGMTRHVDQVTISHWRNVQFLLIKVFTSELTWGLMMHVYSLTSQNWEFRENKVKRFKSTNWDPSSRSMEISYDWSPYHSFSELLSRVGIIKKWSSNSNRGVTISCNSNQPNRQQTWSEVALPKCHRQATRGYGWSSSREDLYLTVWTGFIKRKFSFYWNYYYFVGWFVKLSQLTNCNSTSSVLQLDIVLLDKKKGKFQRGKNGRDNLISI